MNAEFDRKYLLTVFCKTASEGHSTVKPQMWEYIITDLREGESCFKECSSSTIKMGDILEAVSSLVSALYIFLSFESNLKQAFLGLCIGLYRCAEEQIKNTFQISSLQITKLSQFLHIQFYGVFSQAAEKSAVLRISFIIYTPVFVCSFSLI